MLTILFPFLVCLLGLVVFALTANPKIDKLAFAAYCVGLFWSVWEVASKTFRF